MVHQRVLLLRRVHEAELGQSQAVPVVRVRGRQHPEDDAAHHKLVAALAPRRRRGAGDDRPWKMRRHGGAGAGGVVR